MESKDNISRTHRERRDDEFLVETGLINISPPELLLSRRVICNLFKNCDGSTFTDRSRQVGDLEATGVTLTNWIAISARSAIHGPAAPETVAIHPGTDADA
jgi:hypothetical protein